MTVYIQRAQEALGFKKPEPEPVQNSSLTKGLWRAYAKTISKINPTRSELANGLPKLAAAIVLVVPFIIATVATIAADVVTMTAKNISDSYKALRNKFKKPAEPENNKVFDFVKANQKAIIIGSSTLAALGGIYYFRAEIADGISRFKDFFSKKDDQNDTKISS